MIAFAKVVDIIVGLVVLLIAINIVVTPMANEQFNALLGFGQDTIDYLNDTNSDFVPFEIEENFGIAGVSVMGLVNAVKTLVETPFSGFSSEMEVADYVGTQFDNFILAARMAQGNIDCYSGLIEPIVQKYEMSEDTFRDKFPCDGSKDQIIIYTQMYLLNRDIVNQELFGKRIDSKEELKEYLCDYVNNSYLKRLNSFIYLSQDIDLLTDDYFYVEESSVQQVSRSEIRKSASGQILYDGFAHLTCENKRIYLPPKLISGRSYYVAFDIEASIKDVLNVETITIPSKNALKKYPATSNTKVTRATSSNRNVMTKAINWDLIEMPNVVYETENKYDEVGCTQYFDDLRRYCFVTNFELPELMSPDQDLDFLRNRATAYQSPSYIFYYQTMPDGEEDAWGYTLERNILRNIAIAGFTNAAFDAVGLVLHPVKAAKGFKSFVSQRKTISALNELGESVTEKLTSESLQRATRETLVESFYSGQTKTTQAVQAVYLSDLISKSNSLKNYAGYEEILTKAFREEANPIEYLQNLQVVDLKGKLRFSDSVATPDRINTFLGNLKLLSSKVQADPNMLNKVMATTNGFDAVMSKVVIGGGNEFTKSVTEKLVKQLNIMELVGEDVANKIQKRLSSDFNLIFNHMQDVGADVFLSKLNDETLQTLSNSIKTEIAKKESTVVLSNLFFGRQLLGKPLIFGSFVLWDVIQNMGVEKYDAPERKDQFVLYDPTKPAKSDRILSIPFEDQFSTFININKPHDNRFYVASPCKADMLVRREICTCEVPSGSFLLKQGDVLRSVQNVEATQFDTFYLYDQLSDDTKVKLKEEINTNNFFGGSSNTQLSAKLMFYSNLFSEYPGLTEILYGYFQQGYCLGEENRLNSDDNGRESFFNGLLANNYDKEFLASLYWDRSMFHIDNSNSICNNVESYETYPAECLEYDCSKLTLEKFDEVLRIYLNVEKFDNLLPTLDSIFDSVIKPYLLEENFVRFHDCSKEKIGSYGSCFYDSDGVGPNWNKEKFKECIREDENYKFCAVYEKNIEFSQGSLDDQIAREWYVNFMYADFDSEFVANEQMVATCNVPIGDARLVGNEDVSAIKPLSNFLQSTKTADDIGYKKNDEYGLKNYYFKINVPCVDVKTNNNNYLGYNHDNNFCHLGVSSKEQEIKTKALAVGMAATDIGISVAASTFFGPAGPMVAPVINFATGATQAFIIDKLNQKYRWPNNQNNKWSD